MDQETYHAFKSLQPSKQHILNCSYSFWYLLYHEIAPPTTIVADLPQQFVDYLLLDGIWMPQDFYGSTNKCTSSFDEDSDFSDWENDRNNPATGKSISHDGSSESPDRKTDIKESSKNTKQDPTLKFPELHQKLHSIFVSGKAFLPKLNWSAPKDSTWILVNNLLKCTSVNDVYLLLKASSFIVHDLTECFDGCLEDDSSISATTVKYDLILKEWINDFSPSMEFRCFVKNHRLVAISQRDSATYYEFLSKNPQISINLKVIAQTFYNNFIKDTFPDSSLVFDIYVKSPAVLDSESFNEITKLTDLRLKKIVYLIDINPFHRKTDPLLFSWNEILEKNSSASSPDNLNTNALVNIELRLVNQYTSSQFSKKQYSENYVPKDMVDAAMDTEKMIELMKAYNQQHLSSDEEDS